MIHLLPGLLFAVPSYFQDDAKVDPGKALDYISSDTDTRRASQRNIRRKWARNER